jgi:hypothetical protein
MRSLSRISIAVILGVALTGLAWAARQLPPGVVQLAPGIHRLGTAQHRVFGVRVFAATLWITGTTWSPQEPHALDVEASRKIPKQRLIDNLMDEMRDQKAGTPAQLSQWKGHLASLIPELKKGDQLVVFCTEKNKQTMIFYNGSQRGEIADPQFCEALFQVWLHPETSYSDVRRSLLRK